MKGWNAGRNYKNVSTVKDTVPTQIRNQDWEIYNERKLSNIKERFDNE